MKRIKRTDIVTIGWTLAFIGCSFGAGNVVKWMIDLDESVENRYLLLIPIILFAIGGVSALNKLDGDKK